MSPPDSHCRSACLLSASRRQLGEHLRCAQQSPTGRDEFRQQLAHGRAQHGPQSHGLLGTSMIRNGLSCESGRTRDSPFRGISRLRGPVENSRRGRVHTAWSSRTQLGLRGIVEELLEAEFSERYGCKPRRRKLRASRCSPSSGRGRMLDSIGRIPAEAAERFGDKTTRPARPVRPTMRRAMTLCCSEQSVPVELPQRVDSSGERNECNRPGQHRCHRRPW